MSGSVGRVGQRMFEMAKGKYNQIYTQMNALIVQKAQFEVFCLRLAPIHM